MIRNFLFHRVNPNRDPLWDPMDVPLFEKCIKEISRKYEVVLFEEIASSERLGARNKYATIMFDDGYRDNIEFALPILEKYHCKASFYVVTDCIDKNIPAWTQSLEYLFQHTGKSKIDLGFSFLPKDCRAGGISSIEKKLSYVRKLKPTLKKLPSEQRDAVLESINEMLDDVPLPKIMMNWDDLRLLAKAGHYVGSHTVTHNMLGIMSNEFEIKRELVDSGNRIS